MLAYETWERFGWKIGNSIEDPVSMYIGFDFVKGEKRFKSPTEGDVMARSVPGLEGWQWSLYDDLNGNLVDPAETRRLSFCLAGTIAFKAFLVWTAAYDARLREAVASDRAGELPPCGDFPGVIRILRP